MSPDSAQEGTLSFLFGCAFSLSILKCSLSVFHRLSFSWWNFIATLAFVLTNICIESTSEAVPCFCLPSQTRKNKPKKTTNPYHHHHHPHHKVPCLKFYGKDLDKLAFLLTSLSCQDTHLQIRLWSLKQESSCDFSLPLPPTGFAKVGTPNPCNSIRSFQGKRRTDTNVNALFVA